MGVPYGPTVTSSAPVQKSGWSRWGYLIFLAFILIGPVFEADRAAWRWGLDVAVIVISVGLYVWGELGSPHRLAPAGWAMLALAVVVTPFGSSAISVLPIYAGAAVSAVGDRGEVIRKLAVVSLVTVAAIFSSPIPMPFRLFLAVSLIMVWLVGLGAHEEAALMRRSDALAAESARARHLATVTERERIARDLHDVAGQALTAIIVRSQLVQRTCGDDPERARAEAAAMEATARDLLSGIRATVSGWQQFSLVDELDEARKALEASGVTVDVKGEWRISLAPSQETVFALALREATTNVVRHAGARRCSLELQREDSVVRLVVSDDGSGISAPEGSGLRGMRERASAAGGSVMIREGDGVELAVSLPLVPA
jgi:two-component system, NarL family, sensor histidine kinase DesK